MKDLETVKTWDEIEILSGRTVGGQEIWRRYTVLDWETPRLDDKGRWLFTARGEYGIGPNPMCVEPARIKLITRMNDRSLVGSVIEVTT